MPDLLGLGRENQGICAALEVKKTEDGQTAVVVDSDPLHAKLFGQAATRVLLLTNMVGRGEVDPGLEAETAEECSRFGTVRACHVHEMPVSVPDDEAIRIFVEFDDPLACKRALKALDNRYFAGRQVSATFYDEGDFLNGRYNLM